MQVGVRLGRREERASKPPSYFCSWSSYLAPLVRGGLAGCLPAHDFRSVSLFSATGVISEQGLQEEVPPILQHHILKVALELPASKFLWLKAQVGSRQLLLALPLTSGSVGVSAWKCLTGSEPDGWL